MSSVSTGTEWYDPQAVNDAVNQALGIGDVTAAAFGPAVAPPETDEPRTRRAMFLSGGGASGVYEAGVLQAMAINAMRFNALVGTSIGSINAAAYGQLWTMSAAQHHRPLSTPQADFLKSILYFWEYVDQSGIANLDASPARDLLSDLDRLYLSVSSIARFWGANLNPDLLLRPPSAAVNGNLLQRLRYQSRRVGATANKLLTWLETGLMLLPSLLGSLVALPFRLVRRAFDRTAPLGDLYTAAATTLIHPPPATDEIGQDGLAGRGHAIVERAMRAYLPPSAYGPEQFAQGKRSLFSNAPIQAVLKQFPSLRVYQDGADESSAVVQQPSRAALPNTLLDRFRHDAGAEMRFTRTNMRNGNLEVTAVYPLQTALIEASERITNSLKLKQAGCRDGVVANTAAQPIVAVSPGGGDNQPDLCIDAAYAASYGTLLNFITALEALVSYQRLLGKPPVKTGRLLVGNPNVVTAVTASGAFPAAFPPVTIDQIYPIDEMQPDPDNVALREICRLCDLYRVSKPPQAHEQLVATRAEFPLAETLKPSVAAKIVNAMPSRAAALRDFIAACFAFDWPANVTDRQLRIVQLAACIVATWFDSYPIYRPQAMGTEEAFLEQYNDGGAGDALPLGNAIDALEYVVDNDRSASELHDVVHYVYFVHLGDAPRGVRDVGDGSEVDPNAGTLSPATLNRYLFYEYGLRYQDLGKRNRYLSDSSLARKVRSYIEQLRSATNGAYKEELRIEVVNIYPSVALNALVAFDVRLGYNHTTNRKQIAAGCSDTMRTLWEAVLVDSARDGSLSQQTTTNNQEPPLNSRAVPLHTRDLLTQWLVPSKRVEDSKPTLFCRNGVCMYRRECPFGDNAVQPAGVSLIENYDIASASDTSVSDGGGVLTAD